VFVYFCVILCLHSAKPITCKPAKFIRIPHAYSIQVKSNEIADLFFCKDDVHKTIFYVKGNAINFIRMHRKEYRYKANIIELFDYHTWTCNLLIIDRKKYKLIRPTVSPEVLVRSPNGDLYCVVDYTYYFLDGEDDEEYDDRYDPKDNNNYRIFTINNLTKGKVLFSYVETDDSWVRSEDDIALFPYFFATDPLYNSFIVVVRVDVHNALHHSDIYLVNLLEDAVEKIPFDIRGYIKPHIEDLMYEVYIDYLDYSEYDEDEEFDPAEHYKEAYDFDADDIFDTERITISLMSYSNSLIRYQNEVPVYNSCEAKFWLCLKSKVGRDKWEFEITCDIILSIYTENNELNILVTCKDLKVTGFSRDYESEDPHVLLHKKYPLHSINKFNINQSQLCSVTSFFKDYLIKDNNLYKLYDDTYEMIHNSNKTPPFISKRDGVYFIELGPSFNEEFVVIPPRYVGKNNDRYVKIEDKIVDLKSIKKIANMYSEHNKYGIVVNIQEYTEAININELLIKLKKHVKKILQNKVTKPDKIHYNYYFCEKTGDLYMFIILENSRNRNVRFVIVNHKIWKPISNSIIILLSDTYEIGTASEKGKKEKNKLKNTYKLLNEIINRYKALNKNINREKNKKNEDMSFIDFLNYFFHRTINRTAGAWFVYDDNLIVRYHISLSDFFKEFKDIRYNRQAKIQYEGLARCKSTINSSNTKVERYENVLLHRIEIKMSGYYYFMKYDFLTIISEMDVVKNIK
jgi:hypothetical protein